MRALGDRALVASGLGGHDLEGVGGGAGSVEQRHRGRGRQRVGGRARCTVAPSSSAAAPHEATTEATTARLAAVTVARAGSTAATRAVSAAATSCGVVDGGALTAAVGAVVDVAVVLAVEPSMTWFGTPADGQPGAQDVGLGLVDGRQAAHGVVRVGDPSGGLGERCRPADEVDQHGLVRDRFSLEQGKCGSVVLQPDVAGGEERRDHGGQRGGPQQLRGAWAVGRASVPSAAMARS